METNTENDIRADFDALVAQYSGVINKVCYFYATDVDDFKDMRQEALLYLWRGLPKFGGVARPSSWVYRVTLNSCISYFRKYKRKGKAEPIENHPEIISDDDQKALLIREMYAMINCLNDIDKAVILLWLDGNDYETIADVMGMNKNTVGTRIHRIKDKLVEISNK